MAKLILRTPDGTESEISLDDKDSVTIGRSPECDMPIDDGQASRRHASVVRVSDGFEVSDLGSTNGTLLNGAQVKKRRMVHGDVITIGGTHITYDDPSATPAAGADENACALVYAKGPQKGQKIELTVQRTTIGRKESNTVALKDTVASSYHCEVVRDLNGYTIRDLGSTNGTLVNNEMVTEAQLVHGARIRIGNTRFVFQDPAMSEIDLELAGVDDDEAEWGMMREIDLASVRKRNPASIIYALVFVGILGAMGWMATQKRANNKGKGGIVVAGNLHLPYDFERKSSVLDWQSLVPGAVDVSWNSAGKGSLALRASGAEGGAAVYVEEIDARNRFFKLKGKLSASGTTARIGLRFTGAGIEKWVLSGPAGGSMQEFSVDCSAPRWANEVEVGIMLDGEGSARADAISLVPSGRAHIDAQEQGSFQIQVVDGRELEVSYQGAPTLANGRLVAYDAGGGELDGSSLAVTANAEDGDHVQITIMGGGDAALVGVEFTEVNGFLSQGGWRAFTPGQTPDFHASFPGRGQLRLKGVRKLLVGDRGRAFSVTAAGNDGRIASTATVSTPRNRWAILGAPGGEGFSFRIRTNLRGEATLAQRAFSTALQSYSDQRWGDFIETAQSALAELPFASASSKERIAKRMGEVTADRAGLVREARSQIADFDEFRDMESLDRVRAVLIQLAGRHQIKSGEGPAGKTYSELVVAEAQRSTKARSAQEEKLAQPILELAEVNLEAEETYAATVLFSYIVTNLPAAPQATDARAALKKIEQEHPQILKVLRGVGIGK